MCYMTTTTTIYTAPLSIVTSIILFSIPNAPIMSSATMFLSALVSASLRPLKDSHSLSLLPPPRSSLLCRLVVALMPPPLILSTLPPPLNAQPWSIEAPSPVVCWCLSSHLPLVRQLVAALPVGACLRLASPFCRTGAVQVHPRPLLSVRASWLSRCISLHHLCLLTLCHLMTGCVVTVANAQA